MPEEIVIRISGPVGSGKSVLACALKNALEGLVDIPINVDDGWEPKVEAATFSDLKAYDKWKEQPFRIVVSQGYKPE